jgi:hypothetical protein
MYYPRQHLPGDGDRLDQGTIENSKGHGTLWPMPEAAAAGPAVGQGGRGPRQTHRAGGGLAGRAQRDPEELEAAGRVCGCGFVENNRKRTRRQEAGTKKPARPRSGA